MPPELPPRDKDGKFVDHPDWVRVRSDRDGNVAVAMAHMPSGWLYFGTQDSSPVWSDKWVRRKGEDHANRGT